MRSSVVLERMQLDQISSLVCNNYLKRGNIMGYLVLTDLKKAVDRVNRKAMWQVLEIYGIGGGSLAGMKSFY